MKATIFSIGDWDVGIQDTYSYIEFGLPNSVFDDDLRNSIKKQLIPFFSELHDVPERYTEMWFEDECPDCKQRYTQGNCPNCVLRRI